MPDSSSANAHTTPCQAATAAHIVQTDLRAVRRPFTHSHSTQVAIPQLSKPRARAVKRAAAPLSSTSGSSSLHLLNHHFTARESTQMLLVYATDVLLPVTPAAGTLTQPGQPQTSVTPVLAISGGAKPALRNTGRTSHDARVRHPQAPHKSADTLRTCVGICRACRIDHFGTRWQVYRPTPVAHCHRQQLLCVW